MNRYYSPSRWIIFAPSILAWPCRTVGGEGYCEAFRLYFGVLLLVVVLLVVAAAGVAVGGGGNVVVAAAVVGLVGSALVGLAGCQEFVAS